MAGNPQELEVSWPVADPDYTLKALRQLKGTSLPNGEAFCSTYVKWSSLNLEQRNKATAYFGSLTDAVKIAVKNHVAHLETAVANDQHQQAANTLTNNRARFMHCMVDPLNQELLNAANAPLDRQHLDSVNDRRTFWGQIAVNFNDYEHFKYQNLAIKYAVNPYQAAMPTMEAFATYTHSINRNEESRPARDGAWCEKIWKEIRGVATRIHENYRQSGNQEAANKFTERIGFCDNYSDVYKYFEAVISEGFIDNLGRALPETEQRDTDVI